MCAYLYQCLCMSESVCLSEPGCYYGDRSWKCPPTSHPPLLSFHKPLILGIWNMAFKAINYVCVVSIQSHQSDLIISLCSIPVTLHINCFPSTPFLFVFLFPFFFHLVHWCAFPSFSVSCLDECVCISAPIHELEFGGVEFDGPSVTEAHTDFEYFDIQSWKPKDMSGWEKKMPKRTDDRKKAWNVILRYRFRIIQPLPTPNLALVLNS